jgi:hypothetical protein
MSAGFYKVNLVDAGLMYAPNFVHGPGFSLSKNDENKDTMESIEGWKWFNSDSEAYAYYNITPEEQPWSVTPLQAKTALEDAGLLETIESYMITADKKTKIAWDNTSEFRRDSVLLASISQALGLTDAQVDALFEAAKEVEV